jgi:predicted RNA binding protein YcfA (HicA-like mRNA interferase family)
MGKKRKLLQRLLSGSKNVSFTDAVSCAEAFGYRLDRVNGSHHIFVHDQVPVVLNLQNVSGKAKPYQIKQLLQIIEIYNLKIGGDQ